MRRANPSIFTMTSLVSFSQTDMSKTYDFPAADHVETVDVERLRTAWAHLTLLASGQVPATSHAEAAEQIALAFYNIMGENITNRTVPTLINVCEAIIQKGEALFVDHKIRPAQASGNYHVTGPNFNAEVEGIEAAYRAVLRHAIDESLTSKVQAIIERKRQGQDCTQEESTIILQFFDENPPDIHQTGFVKQVAEIFPLEADQWYEESEKGLR